VFRAEEFGLKAPWCRVPPRRDHVTADFARAELGLRWSHVSGGRHLCPGDWCSSAPVPVPGSLKGGDPPPVGGGSGRQVQPQDSINTSSGNRVDTWLRARPKDRAFRERRYWALRVARPLLGAVAVPGSFGLQCARGCPANVRCGASRRPGGRGPVVPGDGGDRPDAVVDLSLELYVATERRN
jgi:hypothetical protein